MNLLETKEEILRLKLELVSIKIEKSEAIQQQDYLRAADLREKEHQVTETVKSQKNELETYLNSLDPDPSNVEEINSIVRMLKEI
jgi:DNA-binding protein H-NS